MILGLSSGQMAAFSCPEKCTCYIDYFDSSKTVECFQQQLRQVPAGIFPGTHVLVLAKNHLKTLTKETFWVSFEQRSWIVCVSVCM